MSCPISSAQPPAAESDAKLAEDINATKDRMNLQKEVDRLRAQLQQAREGSLPMLDFGSPNDFTKFLMGAVTNTGGPEHAQLYRHLLSCFTSADKTFSGFVGVEDFDELIDVAAEAPRKFGFAPQASEMFMSDEERKKARAELFITIDTTKRGKVSFEEFLLWAVEHIKSKVLKGATPWKAGIGRLSLIQTNSAEDFVSFLKEATSSESSPAYTDLYFHLLRTFTDADTTRSGVIDAAGFDSLIDKAAEAPRKYGFAPSAASMFKTDVERKASRAALFSTIDKDNSGTISFNEFLKWAVTHIRGKVSNGARAEYPPAMSAENNLPMYDDATSADDFAKFCTAAVASKESQEYEKLYFHLLRCFSDADVERAGQINAKDFDGLVDVAAAAPRNFGFAPQATEMYLSQEDRQNARSKLFKEINTEGSGVISFQEFLAWAISHIKAKVQRGVVPWKTGVGKLSLIQTESAEDFVSFLKDATSSKTGTASQDLYFHLLRCFTDADTTKSGVIDVDGFDGLIDIAAQAPRKYGFAPSTTSLFKSEQERKSARAKLFATIDKSGSGKIAFHDFHQWAVDHIKEKVSGSISASYPVQATSASTALESKNLPIYDGASSAADFASFCTAATSSKASPEYEQLYYHLLRCFSDADSSLNGRIDADEFDGLIDIAAAAPRKFGFAPQANEMFSSVEERKKARAKLFQSINTDGSGEISFQEFLQWAMVHISAKASGLAK